MVQDFSVILKYFPDLSPIQTEQFSRLKELYEYWNARINVISRKDMEQFYLHHVLHSLGIAKVISFKAGTEVLDVGTGGGFPGIPLAILFPSVNFFLVDSIGKKIGVVNEVVKSLGLKNVKTEQVRAEQLTQRFDFVVSRAITNMQEFHKWVGHLLKMEDTNTLSNGILCLKGGDLSEELKIYRSRCKIFNLSAYFREDFFETKKVVYLPV